MINVAQELPNCEATVLPFIPFLCGDLCYQCTLQGREDHSNSKCCYCIAASRDFKSQIYVGNELTTNNIQSYTDMRVPDYREPEKYGFSTEYPLLLAK